MLMLSVSRDSGVSLAYRINTVSLIALHKAPILISHAFQCRLYLLATVCLLIDRVLGLWAVYESLVNIYLLLCFHGSFAENEDLYFC